MLKQLECRWLVGSSAQIVAARRHKPQRLLFAYISARPFC